MVEATSSGVDRGEYVSTLFEDFVHRIASRGSGSRILDLGPTESTNLMFWIDRSHPIGAVNVARLAPGEPVELDYPDDSLGGAVCWTALSHPSTTIARTLVRRLRRIVMPGGAVFAIFDGDGQHRPPPLRYRILAPDRLAFEPDPDLASPRAVPTREIEALFKSFGTIRVMVMRHGSREVMAVR